MTVFQIEKLTSTYRISVSEQRQVVGGFHHETTRSRQRISEEQLWYGYSNKSYDLVTEPGDTHSTFRKDGMKIGQVDHETGEVDGLVRRGQVGL